MVVLIFVPQVLARPMPDGTTLSQGAVVAVLIVTMIPAVGGMVILPLLFVLFYRSRHVKATCESYHPAPDWSEACPLPLLALSLMFFVGAVTLMVLPISRRHRQGGRGRLLPELGSDIHRPALENVAA